MFRCLKISGRAQPAGIVQEIMKGGCISFEESKDQRGGPEGHWGSQPMIESEKKQRPIGEKRFPHMTGWGEVWTGDRETTGGKSNV